MSINPSGILPIEISKNYNKKEWIKLATHKADWYDPMIQKKDDYFTNSSNLE